ncbi:hypothetical protein, partial [Stenotrophomonas maltophilia]|uniref:hypothetical protein n=1 Tax=Stenotrophomonas maltophilia TaxID=40324 RepID=UPI0013DA90EF
HALAITALKHARHIGVYAGATQLIDDRDQDYVIARSLRGQARHESGTSEQARSAKSAAIKDLRGQLERTKNAGYIPVEDGYSNGSKVV